MTTTLRYLLLILLAPAFATIAQAAGVTQNDFAIPDAGFRIQSTHLDYVDAQICSYDSSGALLQQRSSLDRKASKDGELNASVELKTIRGEQLLLSVFPEFDAANTADRGWLQHWEGIGRGRSVGHTLERHVGQTDADLLARISSNSRIRSASTFTNQSTAEAVIGQTISNNRNQLNAWIRSANPGDRLRLNYNGSTVIGRGATRGEGVFDRTNARVILQMRDNGKYHILTAFPE